MAGIVGHGGVSLSTVYLLHGYESSCRPYASSCLLLPAQVDVSDVLDSLCAFFLFVQLSENHKRKLLGQAALNLVDCIGDGICENLLKLKLTPKSRKIKRIHLEVSVSSRLLQESR